jgi:predicted nucleotidyltransferase
VSLDHPTFRIAQDLARALESAGVAYALGGSIALAYAAEPRATRDVDINLFCPPDHARAALGVLHDAGMDIDIDAALELARERFDARGHVQGVRIDLFFDSIPLHALALKRRVRVDLLGTPVWVLSAEDLAVLKAMFDRDKDWVDIAAMVADRGDRFDRAYVRGQLADHLGGDDPRLVHFEHVCRKLDETEPRA